LFSKLNHIEAGVVDSAWKTFAIATREPAAENCISSAVLFRHADNTLATTFGFSKESGIRIDLDKVSWRVPSAIALAHAS
jgi:hypothetical protein